MLSCFGGGSSSVAAAAAAAALAAIMGFSLGGPEGVPVSAASADWHATLPRLACRAGRRVFLLDHDGTLVAQSTITSKPSQDVLK
jgi:hypothetical protein